jgi:hypothetical protein
MIAPDRMVMRDSPAIRNHCVECPTFDCEPLRAELARLAERVECEIGSGAVGIDMREAAGDSRVIDVSKVSLITPRRISRSIA